MTKFIEPLLQAVPEFQWTLARYHEAIRVGLFTTADRIELVYGKIIDRMPSGGTHAECVQIVADYFRGRFLTTFIIREEKPITFKDNNSEPEPDIAVVSKQRYSPNHPVPSDTHLVVEVADSSIEKDQTIKVVLYAEANIAEYWIINLPKRRVEVHLNPLPDERTYGSVNNYGEEESFESPFAGTVKVVELLPEGG